MVCDDLEGSSLHPYKVKMGGEREEGSGGRGYKRIHIADPCCRTAEMNTILSSNDTPIQKMNLLIN